MTFKNLNTASFKNKSINQNIFKNMTEYNL